MREDTIHLLGDCTAGIELAVSAMNGLIPDIKDRALRQRLREGIQEHKQLQKETVSMLRQYGAAEKTASAMAKGLSWLRTNTRMPRNKYKAISSMTVQSRTHNIQSYLTGTGYIYSQLM